MKLESTDLIPLTSSLIDSKVGNEFSKLDYAVQSLHLEFKSLRSDMNYHFQKINYTLDRIDSRLTMMTMSQDNKPTIHERILRFMDEIILLIVGFTIFVMIFGHHKF